MAQGDDATRVSLLARKILEDHTAEILRDWEKQFREVYKKDRTWWDYSFTDAWKLWSQKRLHEAWEKFNAGQKEEAEAPTRGQLSLL